jgi:hydroxymethylpyrimidine pyrophosphatase-like HAD family hydrolase
LGRPYSTELSELEATYAWAFHQDIANLTQVLGKSLDLPVIAVGSGGALSSAHFMVGLHECLSGQLGNAMTPLEFSHRIKSRSDMAVMFLSASGRNPDVVNAFRAAAKSEPASLVALCMQPESKVADLSRRYQYTKLLEFAPPTEKDGFLATNSLLATCVLLYRAYRAISDGQFDGLPALPKTYRKLLSLTGNSLVSVDARKAHYSNLWKKEHLVVLHDPATHAAAIDLESKFTEAALGTVQIADYRNFAHGRHHWLAKHGETSAVLAISSEAYRDIARKTLALLPNDIQSAHVAIGSSGPLACLCALTEVLHIAGSAGDSRGIDPGRPGVPPFGRKIYHLSVGGTSSRLTSIDIPQIEMIAIARKVGTEISVEGRKKLLSHWRNAYGAYVRKLTEARFSALVLDYDGTICSESERASGLGEVISTHLVTLLKEGILLGVATGRGESARAALREAIPKTLWEKVVVGYHNGAEVGMLGDDSIPDKSQAPAHIIALCKALKNEFSLNSLVQKFKPSIGQISLRLKPDSAAFHACTLLAQILAESKFSDYKISTSGHSVDVLAPTVSKIAVHKAITDMIRAHDENSDGEILCIGDRGRIPGNDAALLATSFSLSVDDASTDADSCWNLAPPGMKGTCAMIWYFKTFRYLRHSRFRVHLAPSRR